ncbi:MAG: M48 family metallopeptidase [Methylohalobius crimeensis]
MTRLEGYYYDGRSARGHPAEAILGRDGRLSLTRAGQTTSWPLRQVRISSRLGGTPRHFYLPDGGKFETLANDDVDRALDALGLHAGQRWLHRLESHLGWVVLFAAAVGLFSWGFVRYGVPMLAQGAAFALPAETSAEVGQGALAIMDRTLFRSSRLPAERRRNLQQVFSRLVAAQPPDYAYRLVFRRGEKIGANAFALPSGTIVMTDELVKLARRDEELLGVMAHEVGHVIHRHGLRRLIQDSLVAMLIIWVTGDLSASSSLGAALPTLLVERQYSRAFETEADRFAAAYFCKEGLDPAHFAAFLERLEEEFGGREMGYLATHPSTSERIAEVRDACPAMRLTF